MRFTESSGDEKKQDFMPLSEAAKIAGYTPEHLNLLCRKGLLRGEKLGRNWYTKEAWLAEYFSTKNKVSDNSMTGAAEEPEESMPVAVKNIPWAQVVEETSSHRQENKTLAEDFPGKDDECSGDAPVHGLRHLLLINSMAAVAAFVAIGGIYFSISQKLESEKAFAANGYELAAVPSTVSDEGHVLGEETVDDKQLAMKAGILASENYQISEVAFGGDVAVMDNDHNGGSLEISNVRSETLTSKDQKDNKIMVTWKTNKLAKSELIITRNGSAEEKKFGESEYGFTHSIVVSELEPSTTYMYAISGEDRWGNVAKTDQFGAYIGAKPESIFELIAKNFSEMFQWATKD